MTFREQWLAEAGKQKGFRKRRMERIAENPKALKRAERLATEAYGEGAIDWGEFLKLLLPLLLKLFGL